MLPLGGLGEIGKNCMVLDDGERALMIDCGVTFKEQEYGVDAIHADFAAIELQERLAGVVLTHGHEDHIGALPYLLRRHDVPVYGPPYALRLVEERLREHGMLGAARLIATTPRTPFSVGTFEVEPLRVSHSVVDATALVVRTRAGTVLHTGDFKFDDRAPFGETVDEQRIAEIARGEGIALLLSDSTNAMVPGSTTNEVVVHEELETLIASAKGAVIVSMFASNVARLNALGQIAVRTRRRLALLGRSMRLHAQAGQRAGYVQWPEGLQIASNRLDEVARDGLLVLVTGSQAEPRAALARLAGGTHPDLRIELGDRIILSSRVIPGHEPEVSAVHDDLLRLGGEVLTGRSHPRVHASGHACRDEQQRMIELAEPRAFVPVHGARQHLEAHRTMARELGVASDLVVENGQAAHLLDNGALEAGERFAARGVRVFAGRTVSDEVVRERRRIAEHGHILVMLRKDEHGAVRGDPVVVVTGLAEGRAAHALEAEASRGVKRELAAGGPYADDAALLAAAKYAARRVVVASLGVKPETTARLLP